MTDQNAQILQKLNWHNNAPLAKALPVDLHWQMMLGTEANDNIGQVVKGIADIEQALKIICTSQKGSVPHDPNFAIDISSYLDKPSPDSIPLIISELTVGIQTYEPRALLLGITAEIVDYSKEVSNLFRILQRHYPFFIDHIKYSITSRANFQILADTPSHTLTDLERAAKFLYMQRTAFGGKVSGQNFGVSADRPARLDPSKLVPMLEDLHTRLSGVVIECLSFEKFTPKYDKPGTLFYLDPPYFGCENDYGKDMFSRSDFETLANILHNIKGRFILSLNDMPEIREIFKSFNIEQVETTYTLAKNSSKRVGELIIYN